MQLLWSCEVGLDCPILCLPEQIKLKNPIIISCSTVHHHSVLFGFHVFLSFTPVLSYLYMLNIFCSWTKMLVWLFSFPVCMKLINFSDWSVLFVMFVAGLRSITMSLEFLIQFLKSLMKWRISVELHSNLKNF